MKKLPSLHEQAFKFKNSKRLQHDGGGAWIKDSQLQEARKDANGRFVTAPKQLKVPWVSTTIQRKKNPIIYKRDNSQLS